MGTKPWGIIKPFIFALVVCYPSITYAGGLSIVESINKIFSSAPQQEQQIEQEQRQYEQQTRQKQRRLIDRLEDSIFTLEDAIKNRLRRIVTVPSSIK